MLGPSNLEHCLWILRTVIDFPQSLAAGAIVVCCIHIHWLPVTLHGHHCPHCLFPSLPSLASLREGRRGRWADKTGKGYSRSTFPSKQDASFPRRELATAVQLSLLSPSAAATISGYRYFRVLHLRPGSGGTLQPCTMYVETIQ